MTSFQVLTYCANMNTMDGTDSRLTHTPVRICSRGKSFLTTMLCLVVFVICVGCVARQQTITYFYLVACHTCEESQRMEQVAWRVINLRERMLNARIDVYDITNGDSMEVLSNTVAELGIDLGDLDLPILIVNGTLHNGETAVAAVIDKIESKVRR